MNSNFITQDDVIYFIVTDRFFGKNKSNSKKSDNKIHNGTLDGILSKLDYLEQLGVTAIWITPVYKNIDNYNGDEPYHYYWVEDFDELDSRLIDKSQINNTGLKALEEFVKKCQNHSGKFKVILDMIVNHAGYNVDIYGKYPRDWFNNGNTITKMRLYGLPDFNHDKPEVLEYFIKNINNWMNACNIINIRMDTAKQVEDKFWYYFKSQIRGEKPNLFFLGEVMEYDIELLQKYQNYYNFDSIFDFPLSGAIRASLIWNGNIRNSFARPRLSEHENPGILDYDNPEKNGYREPNNLVTMCDIHDSERRIMSEARLKYSGTSNLPMAIKVIKLCLGALFTIRGIPLLYYGTEIGLEGWKNGSDDCDLRRDFPWDIMGTDNKPTATYEKEKEIYEWTKSLIALRKNNPALKHGTTFTLWSDNFIYSFLRIATDNIVLVLINNGEQDMPYPLDIDLDKYDLSEDVKNRIILLKSWDNSSRIQVLPNSKIVQIKTTGKSITIYTGLF